jgi:high-affinity Fe2+/Pb2+ permease
MLMRNKNKKSLAMALAISLVLAIFVVLVVNRIVSPREFAVCSVAMMSVAACIWYLLLSSAKEKNEKDNASMKSSHIRGLVKSRVLIIAGIALFIPFSLWMTRGGPLLPRFIGVCFLVALLIGNLLNKTNITNG